MLPFYLGSLVLGGVLILASIVLGGGDDDFDKDLGIDKDFDLNIDGAGEINADIDVGGGMDADMDAATGELDGENWLPFLSMRFWTFALACFGMSGTIMDILGTSPVVSAPIAAITGIALGWGVAYVFHRLKRDSVSSNTSSTSLLNQEGFAILPVSKELKGKIRLSLGTEVMDLVATTNDPMPIERGEKIMVVSVENGTAVISSLIPPSQKKIQTQSNTLHPPKKELE